MNRAPELPSTISVYYNDSTVESKNVTWEKVARLQAGNFTLLRELLRVLRKKRQHLLQLKKSLQ